MGWNALHFPKDRPRSPLFSGLEEGEHVYFVHSYAGFACAESLIATAEYGVELTAAVQRGNVFGTQFHPEKSGETGTEDLARLLRTGGITMILLPAIDLYGGKVVRLTRGDYREMTVYRDDPTAQAGDFQAAGASWLHTVDLEGGPGRHRPQFPRRGPPSAAPPA